MDALDVRKDILPRMIQAMILIAILALAFMAYETYDSLQVFTKQRKEESSCLRILKYTEELTSYMSSMETSYHGFLLMKDSNILKIYQNSLDHYQSSIDSLLIDDYTNPREKQRIITLIVKAKENTTLTSNILAYATIAKPEQEELNNLIVQSKECMDSIRITSFKIEESARKHLSSQHAEQEEQIQHTRNVFLLLAIGLAIYLLVSYIVIQREMYQRKKIEETLSSSEQSFSTLFYKSPFIYTITDVASGKFIEANQAMSDYYGYSIEEMKNSSSLELSLYIEDSDRNKMLQHLNEHKSLRSYELKTRKKNGEIRWISVDSDVVNIMGKECLLTAITDITKTKSTEEYIRKLNARLEKKILERTAEVVDYKFALDSSAIVAITDQKGVIKYVNQNFCKISKYSSDELIGQDHRILNSGYHSKEFIRGLWTTIANGQIWKGEIRNKAKDGTLYWVDTTIIPFLNEEKKPYQYVATRYDITQKKKAEEALRYSEANIRSIFEHTEVGFLLIGKDFNVISFNNVASNYVKKKFKKTLTIHSNYSEYYPLERREIVTEMIHQALNGRAGSYEVHYVDDEGISNWYFTRFIPISYVEGLNTTMMIQMTNITERKNLEIYREKMTAEILQRNRDLEQFAYIISHNLRAPVANIIGLTAMLNSPGFKQENESKIKEGISISVSKMDEVIRDLNTILQIRGEVTEMKETVSFTELINDIRTSISKQIENCAANFELDFSEIDEILTLKGYMYSIFYNLISNSLKYKQPGIPPLIRIKSMQGSNKINLVFSDNGTGFDLSKKKDQVFGLYKRFHQNIEGKGMGLYMVKTQVETLGGRISVSSEPGKGTQFTIEFSA